MTFTAQLDSSAEAVAYLYLHHKQHPDANKSCAVYPNDQFDFGRKQALELWDVHEPTISTHHLRFRCVMFENDGEEKVPPMVYVRVLSSNNVQFSRATLQRDRIRHTIARTELDTLLDHGDILHLTPDISMEFQTWLTNTQNESVSATQAAEITCFSDQFHLTERRLGVGGNASVFVAVKQRTSRQVACKVVAVPVKDQDLVHRIKSDLRLTPAQQLAKLKAIERRVLKARQNLPREYSVLKNLDHPNIIRLEKVICATNNTYIFQELVTGGDLTSYVDRNGALGEAQTAIITMQILKAVDFLHDNGVVHRDIKPENILMTSWREGARIVLTDFGQSRTLEEAKAEVKDSAVFRMHSVVGTHGYTAPEVLKQVKRELRDKGYSKSVDIWSIGCLTASILTNETLFSSEATESSREFADSNAFESSQRWKLDFMDAGGIWASVTRKAKSFISGCVVLDENERFTAKQALSHAWFTNRHYAADIEAAYQRAIQDWTPRQYDGDLVEYMDTSDAVRKLTAGTAHVEHPAEQIKSTYFDTLPPPPKSSLFFKSAIERPQYQNPDQRLPTPDHDDTCRESVPLPESYRLVRHDSCTRLSAKQVGTDGQMFFAGPSTSDCLPHSPYLVEEVSPTKTRW